MIHAQWHGNSMDRSGVAEFIAGSRPSVHIPLDDINHFHVLEDFLHHVEKEARYESANQLRKRIFELIATEHEGR